MRYSHRLDPQTALERHVCLWLKGEAKDRDGDIAGVVNDLVYGGCSSGMVGHLVYTHEAARFYRKHRRDIGDIVTQLIDSLGEWSPTAIDGWDKDDPLALTDHNQNYLAWLGFEEAVRSVAQRAGMEDV